MPHVIIKLYPGRSEAQKEALSREVASKVVEITACEDRSVSVAIEEIDPLNWPLEVYQPDIMEARGRLYKKPGYNPFESASDEPTASQRLMTFVRSAMQSAEASDATGYFNAMSWLDMELEDNPQMFDPCFDIPWDQLDASGKQERAAAVRSAL